MSKGLRASTWAALSLAVAGFGLAGCGLKEPPPFDPTRVNQPEISASVDAPQSPMAPLPRELEDLTTQPSNITDTSESDAIGGGNGNPATRPTTQPSSDVQLRRAGQATTGRALRDDMLVRMPLQDVIQRSVLHSSEVRVAGYDPAVAKTRVLEALARFDPSIFVNPKIEHLDTQILFSGVERGEIISSEQGLKQNLPSGGEVQLSYQVSNNNVELRPSPVSLNPSTQSQFYWDDQLKFQITQPLLRNFGSDVNQARITIARNDVHVSVLDFRKTLEENIAEIEKDYWQLQEAEAEVHIQEQLLRQTRDTARILFQQVINGNQGVSRVQTSQAQASIRSREAVLIRARARIRDISDDIKRRMNDPEFPVAGDAVVMPYDGPSEHQIFFEIHDQVATAVANRFELGQQRLRINSAQVAERVALNNALPKLDLVGSVQLEGLGRKLGESVQNQFGNDSHWGWTLGFNFELPLGNRESRAIVRRSKLQRLQAIEQYRNLVGQVTLDVTTAVREIETSWNEIGSRRQARFAQADQLAALEDRRQVGAEALTPTFVQLLLDAQERLADAQREEALAVASYQVAIARLERAKGTLLRYNNVVLAEDQFKGMDQ